MRRISIWVVSLLLVAAMVVITAMAVRGQTPIRKPGSFEVKAPRVVRQKIAVALSRAQITIADASSLWTSAESAYSHHQDNTLLFDRYAADDITLKQLRKKLAPTYRPQFDDFCYEGWVLVGTNYWDFPNSIIIIATYWYCEETGLHMTCLEIAGSGNSQCGTPY